MFCQLPSSLATTLQGCKSPPFLLRRFGVESLYPSWGTDCKCFQLWTFQSSKGENDSTSVPQQGIPKLPSSIPKLTAPRLCPATKTPQAPQLRPETHCSPTLSRNTVPPSSPAQSRSSLHHPPSKTREFVSCINLPPPPPPPKKSRNSCDISI